MNNKERIGIASLLFFIVVMVAADLVTDSKEGARWWHLAIEGAAGLSAGVGLIFLLKDSFRLKQALDEERRNFSNFKVEAELWRAQSKKFMEGLSDAIDSQLTAWNLSASEKEVAFLLLKGLSLKEISDVRKTNEKTCRAQSVAIYSKSGLKGRSELAAFFLEDLLPPNP